MLKRRTKRRLRRIPRFKGLTFSKLVPNIITIAATCAGLTGVRYALDERWEHAVIAIFVAAVLDALDGRMARLLKSASEFGAELDSLSDFVAFGVSPALILYFWTLESLGGVGWAAALFLAVCCGLRLARFNTNLGRLPPYAYNYFTGVPAPAGAALALLPLVATFAFGFEELRGAPGVAVWSIIVAVLMVSSIPTYSFKKAKIPQGMIVPVLLFALLFVVGLIGATWKTLTIGMLFYIISFAVSMRSFSRLRSEAEHMQHPDESDDEPTGGAGEKRPEKPRLRPVD